MTTTNPMQYQLLPSLSEHEYEALKADIAARGVMVPVEKDEVGNILDGFHRSQICAQLGITDYPVTIRCGMTHDEKIHHALALNLDRRHLEPEQRRELVGKLRIAHGWSNRMIADAIGVGETTVRRDLNSTAPNGAVEKMPERTIGKDGKERPAHRAPQTITARNEQQANAALHCVGLTGMFDGNDTVTAVEVIQDANKTLYATNANRLAPMMTSDSHEWYTPPGIIERARQVMGDIELDPCTTLLANETVKAQEIYTADDDGMSRVWVGKTWMNPPYGDGIGRWTEKLHQEYQAGNVTQAIALLPARTDTAWFRVLRDYPKCFIFGRIQFGGPQNNGNSATFPSVAVALGCNLMDFTEAFKEIGDIYIIAE